MYTDHDVATSSPHHGFVHQYHQDYLQHGFVHQPHHPGFVHQQRDGFVHQQHHLQDRQAVHAGGGGGGGGGGGPAGDRVHARAFAQLTTRIARTRIRDAHS